MADGLYVAACFDVRDLAELREDTHFYRSSNLVRRTGHFPVSYG
jgi:hypothetical protein